MTDIKELVKTVNATFERGDTEGFLAHCAEEINWTMAGEKTVSGKSAIREWMGQMEGCEPPVIRVASLIAEGDGVVCTGDMDMKAADGPTEKYDYCDVYRFDGDKIAELTSFVVKAKGDDEKSAAA